MRVRLISISTSSRSAGECAEGSTRLAGCIDEATMSGRVSNGKAKWLRRTGREAAGWGGHGGRGREFIRLGGLVGGGVGRI